MSNCFYDDDAFYSLADIVRAEKLGTEAWLDSRMDIEYRIFKKWCEVFVKEVTGQSFKEYLETYQSIKLTYEEKRYIYFKYFRKTGGTPCNTK